MRRSLVLLALLVGPATRLAAQAPAERAATEALRDSLARVTDSLSLKRLETATIQVAKQNRDDPLIHLRLGFIAYRLGEITNHKSHDDDAAGEFEWATQLKPDWPYPWYGRGLADLAQGEHAVIAIENIRAILGKDYLSKAALAFARATQVDPSLAEAAMDVDRGDRGDVARAEELAAFDGFTSRGARAAWLERFWLRRDVAEVRNPGERLAEHYRRWFYAWHNYRLVSRHRHYDITERYRSDQGEFDDRGIIYLRHGQPDKIATYPWVPGRLEPNETWLYHGPGGDLVFHFVAREDVQDYKLVESLADALTAGFGGALALQGRRDLLDHTTSELFASRSDISPIYARLANPLGSATVGGTLATERDLGQRSIALGTNTDSYHRTFAEPLETVASEFVAGARPGPGQELHVVFAIPAPRLVPTADSGRVAYALTFRLFVADSSDSLVARLDTTRVFTAREPLRPGAYLTGQLALRVPPGRYRYRRP